VVLGKTRVVLFLFFAATAAGAQTIPSAEEVARRFVLDEAMAERGPTRASAAAATPRRRMSRAERERRRLRRAQRDALAEVGQVLSTIFYRFFYGMTPGLDGVERPNPDERLIEEFEVRLGDTALSYVLQGVGNYRFLSRSYFYQQLDGIHSLRVNFVPLDEGSPFRISLTLSPLHGSISLVNRHMGVYEAEDLPDQVLYGGAVGVDGSYHSGPLTVAVRAYVMPEVDLGWTGATGIAQFQSIQMVFNLTEAAHWRTEVPIEASVMLLHMDRGEARRPLYDWAAGDFRGVGDIREVWQGMTTLMFRYN
jgi:hypothetical protein